MLKLHKLENTELSAYCLSILGKHDITLVREFISEKPEKIMKILNLNDEQVKKIKVEFRRLYGPKLYSIDESFFEEEEKRKQVYGTYIDNLDSILAPDDNFGNLSFWEICGPTGVGKTQMAFTLMLNFVINQVSPALYIDTKLDFSASRVKSMLEAREIDPDLYAGIMSFIKVERVLTPQGVVEVLKEFYKQLQQGNKDVTSIKLILIDSLPAAWGLLKADDNRLAGKWLLSQLSQIINLLVRQYYIAIISVNLSLIPSHIENEMETIGAPTSYSDNDVSDLIEADDMELDDSKSSSLAATYRPSLGYFWLSKPQVRLSLEFPDKGHIYCKEDSSLRIIKLINTRFGPSGISCSVKLQPEGIV